MGGAGSDTYVFAKGDGLDTIIENDSAAGNIDSLRFFHAMASFAVPAASFTSYTVAPLASVSAQMAAAPLIHVPRVARFRMAALS